jgi:hypothetical protein
MDILLKVFPIFTATSHDQFFRKTMYLFGVSRNGVMFFSFIDFGGHVFLLLVDTTTYMSTFFHLALGVGWERIMKKMKAMESWLSWDRIERVPNFTHITPCLGLPVIMSSPKPSVEAFADHIAFVLGMIHHDDPECIMSC